MQKKKPSKPKASDFITIKCNGENKVAIEQFLVWMSESGEQQYWDWMTYREDELDGPITISSFEYDFENGEIKAGPIGRQGNF